MLTKVNGREVIFIHVPKTAGTSVLGSLLDDSSYKVTGHPFASSYSSNNWCRSFSFSVVRNPFDRFISHWLYHTTNYDGKIFKNNGIEIEGRSLDEYCEIIRGLSSTRPNWRTMTEFLEHPSGKCLDFLLRFEHLQNDWVLLCKILDISKDLLRLKSTPHAHYNEYYSKKSKDFVREWYYEDFVNFDYGLE